jgi:hypothetical protein
VLCEVLRLSSMGKRGRRRIEAEPARRVRPQWQTARVSVDDATWAEWRVALGERSVTAALGAYVELEVAKVREHRATRAQLTEREVAEVLQRIEASQAALEALTRRLEDRLRRRPG